MTDRERLICLLSNYDFDSTFCNVCERPDDDCAVCGSERLADYLISNGVIVLPCKVDDIVYYITGIGHNLIKSAKIKEIIIDENGIKDLYVAGDGHNFENSFDIFYLSKEQAEQALLKN